MGTGHQPLHAWGLGKSGRTVSRTRDAVLTDQSSAVLVVKRVSAVVFSLVRFSPKHCFMCPPTTNTHGD